MKLMLRIAVIALASLAVVTSAAQGAEEPADRYNIPDVGRGTAADRELPVKTPTVLLRDVNGNPLTNIFGAPLYTTTYACATAANLGNRCLYLQAFEEIKGTGSDGLTRTLYYTWDGSRQAEGFFPGYVWLYDVVRRPTMHPEYVRGNGTLNGVVPADASGSPRYVVRPNDLSHGQMMRYFPNTCPNAPYCQFTPYGRPYADANAAMMVWSWPRSSTGARVEGGGVARGIVANGSNFYPSNVQPITTSTFASEADWSAGRPNGSVTVRFGRVTNSFGFRAYGWMVMSHVYNNRCYDHMSYASGGAQVTGACTSFMTSGLNQTNFGYRGSSISSASGDVVMEVGDYLMSKDLRSTLIMQSDGNLVLYRAAFGSASFFTGTQDVRPQMFRIGQNGGLSVQTGSGTAPVVWSNGTAGQGPVTLTLRDDGNLVLTKVGETTPIWQTNTSVGEPAISEATNTVRTSQGTKLPPGQSLQAGQYMRSPSGRYALAMQSDGNLVLYGPGYKYLWYNGRQGSGSVRATMQTDGNFVTYTASNSPTWYTSTQGNAGAYLVLQDDGNLVIYYSSGVGAPWNTATFGRF